MPKSAPRKRKPAHSKLIHTSPKRAQAAKITMDDVQRATAFEDAMLQPLSSSFAHAFRHVQDNAPVHAPTVTHEVPHVSSPTAASHHQHAGLPPGHMPSHESFPPHTTELQRPTLQSVEAGFISKELASMNAIIKLVTPCPILRGLAWDPRSLVNYLVGEIRLRNANPTAIQNIEVAAAESLSTLCDTAPMTNIMTVPVHVKVIVKHGQLYTPHAPQCCSACGMHILASGDICRLIPKPKGQVTRRKRGGYKLLDALGWTSERYTRVKDLVQRLAAAHLDISKAYSRQIEEDVHMVCRLACAEDPELLNYEGIWPVHDMLQIYLHYMSQR